jgi:hypothetical protein
VRYADDLVAGFEHEDDARRFLDAMRERFDAFALALHPEKTRLIEFGPMQRPDARAAGSADRKPSRSWASPTSAVDPAGDTSSFKGRPGATVSGRSYRKSRRSYGGECTSQSLFRDPG